MTDGDSCCIAVAAKNISPVTTLSPLLSRFISKRQSSPLPRVPRFPRAPRFPPPFTLSAPTNAFSFRVARRILLLPLLRRLLVLLLVEFVNASHNRVRIITYLCVSESRKESYSETFAIPEGFNMNLKKVFVEVTRQLIGG